MADTAPPPLCFVLMPFGKKEDNQGRSIDFDRVYESILRPATLEADMEPLRADEEAGGGIIHKPMFERLILCPFALADLTLANANVFYELGVRHAVRPHTTVLVFARGGQRLPFDVQPLRAIPYELDDDGEVADTEAVIRQISERLIEAREPTPDSPLYQLLDGFEPPDVARLKTDVFRDRVRYSQKTKERLAQARTSGLAAVREVHEDLPPLRDQEAGILIDLLLSYRDVEAYQEMVDIVAEMGAPVATSVLVNEQLAFALNRLGRRDEAEAVLTELIEEQGGSSETYGLLGRIHKDRWQDEIEKGRTTVARAHLRKAVLSYRRGFELDWRDHYPGVNAVTLLAIEGNTTGVEELLPVVKYSVGRRIHDGRADYWDWATALELAVLQGDWTQANEYLGECLALRPATWQKHSTKRNLLLLREFVYGDPNPAEFDEILAALE